MFAAACLLQAQPASLTGPACGFVYDAPSRSVRPLVGIPGSAYIGAPVYSDVEFASVAPNARMAVAVKAGQVWLIRDLSGPRPEESLLEGAISRPGMIAWAPDSSAFVLYCSAQASVQRVTVQEDTATVHTPLEVPALGGPIAVIATDAAARSIVLGVRDEAAGGLYLLGQDAPPVRIAAMRQPSAVVFSTTSPLLYAADLADRRILTLRGPLLQAALELIPLASTAAPVGLALSRDGRRLFVADQAGASVRVYDTSGLVLIAEAALEAPPAFLHPLSASSLFLLNLRRELGEPLFLLDSRSTPSVYFVPAGEQE